MIARGDVRSHSHQSRPAPPLRHSHPTTAPIHWSLCHCQSHPYLDGQKAGRLQRKARTWERIFALSAAPLLPPMVWVGMHVLRLRALSLLHQRTFGWGCSPHFHSTWPVEVCPKSTAAQEASLDHLPLQVRPGQKVLSGRGGTASLAGISEELTSSLHGLVLICRLFEQALPDV